jgi:hypothetical protein
MYDSGRRARERIIAVEIMKLERRQAGARSGARAQSGPHAGSGRATPPGGAGHSPDGPSPER